MEWFNSTWVKVGAIVALAIPLARAVVALTKTDADDKFVEKIVNFLKGIFGMEIKPK